jgi:type III secretory pathway lipoprotein EscJ
MIISRELNFFIYKDEDYVPISSKEKRRVAYLLSHLLFNLANRFDGSVKVKIHITLKGNA